jgi:hypothetical protein
MQGNAVIALFVARSDIHMLFTDPKWMLTEDREYSGAIDIDDDGYTIHPVGIDATTIAVFNLTPRFVKSFLHGDNLKAYLGSDTWRVPLSGSRSAARDMVACVIRQRGYDPFER